MITVITPTARGKEALKIVEKALKRQTLQGFEWLIEEATTPKESCVWSLNRDMNNAIRRAKGDVIVSWQDYTFANADTLERFYTHYKAEPKTCVTAVGNKYADEEFLVETWRDPRIRSDQGSFYPCYFNDIEWNLCAVPKEAIYKVGGFDEELDKWYGMDGYSVLDRINMVGGYDFKIDQAIRSYSLEHSRLLEWEEKNAIHGPYEKRRIDYLKSPILTYL